ncbi:signal recognition particle receptor subunit beta [Fopius arisanus]|uniref:Signal recognition particle receptor subunit beta n=1 Tax=Fopius arisanus TaxID=64838 RepID=A0A9R1TYM9_9HYME|nr:PREDICTED: signal recognition particle receptor subunit beta [Fopius arisanus]
MEKRAEPLLKDDEMPQLFGIIVAIFIIILTIVLFIVWQRKKSVGRSVLITGLCDAGKTLLYARLVHLRFIETYTSAKENIGDIEIKENALRIVDIPGHERLRYKFFDKYKSSVRGLIYVIDSVTFQKDIRDVAEFFYTLLCDSAVRKSLPILVLCNKQDQTLAKSSTVIRNLLEKELNLVRLTKSSQLEATDASSNNTFLGKEGKDFQFDDLNLNLEFAECSAFSKDSETSADIEQLQDWLERIA